MYSTLTHSTKELNTSRNFNAAEQVTKVSILKKMLMQMKHQVLAAVQVPQTARDEKREEMYW